MGSLTQWRGQSDTTLGRFGWGFLASLLLHVPLMPIAALFGLLTLFSVTEPPPVALPPMTGIPVDLIDAEEAEVPPPATPPPRAPEPAVALEPPTEKPRHDPDEPRIRDAGVSDAEASDASADAATEGNDAGLEDGGITDPVAASGAEKIADVNANVQIKIFTEKIRSHPLAPRIGRTIALVPQWNDFFGPAALDPVADVDRLLVYGPQLRDSSEVGVVVKVNVSRERVRAAMDGIVQSDPANGAWLDAGVPAVTARVDRAQRIIIHASPTIVVVTPPSAADDVYKHGKKITLKASGGPEVLTAKVVTPWRVLRGSGIRFDIPKSIEWARFKVTPDEHDGAIVEIIAKDESPEKAAEDAALLERNLNALNQLDLGIFGALLGTGRHKFVEKIVLASNGDEIHGFILVTARQFADILDFAPMLLGGRAPPRPRERPERRGSDAGAPLRRNTPSAPPSPSDAEPSLGPTPSPGE